MQKNIFSGYKFHYRLSTTEKLPSCGGPEIVLCSYSKDISYHT